MNYPSTSLVTFYTKYYKDPFRLSEAISQELHFRVIAYSKYASFLQGQIGLLLKKNLSVLINIAVNSLADRHRGSALT